MKKRYFIITLSIALSLFAACRKDKQPPPFSATGYWNGVMLYYDVSLINREDGTVRFYIQVPNGDTAATVMQKLDGTYTSKANSYHAVFPLGEDSSFLDARSLSSGQMEGTYSATSALGVHFLIDLKK
jgi:hypothetical protein